MTNKNTYFEFSEFIWKIKKGTFWSRWNTIAKIELEIEISYLNLTKKKRKFSFRRTHRIYVGRTDTHANDFEPESFELWAMKWQPFPSINFDSNCQLLNVC